MRKLAYGRRFRAPNLALPHYDKLKLVAASLPTPPNGVDNASTLPANIGMMLNSTLGCCTCSAAGHSEQTWTNLANPPMVTAPDSAVLSLYEAMGYVPGDPNTDNGAVIEDVLAYWLKTGFNGKKLLAYFRVNPANGLDVQRVIWECGLIYTGMGVPAFFGEAQEAAGAKWDVQPGADATIVDGHCTISAKATLGGDKEVESWGSPNYSMTQAWWDAFVDEAWALVHPDWYEATGLTPLGLSVDALQAMMQSQ